MQMIYLIDYENVGYPGLSGVTELHKEDTVYIFHNIALKTIPFKACKELMSSLAEIYFIETTKTAKNYLDFQLSTHLGFLYGSNKANKKNEVCIVSNDTGYDSVIDYWKSNNFEVQRKSIIRESLPKIKKKKQKKTEKLSDACKENIRKAVKHLNLPLNDYTEIYQIFSSCKAKDVLHNGLVLTFSNKKGLSIYKALKPVY